MKCGICVCGLNGCGKTTLAKALAKELNFKHMDIENYYFSPEDDSYSSPKGREEVETLLLNDIKDNPSFVFSVVNPNITAEINKNYDIIVYLSAPLEIRIKRIKARSFEKFGKRILPGGDMHEKEKNFEERVAKKDSAKTEAWLKSLTCKVIYLDGTRPIAENLKQSLSQLR